MIKFENVTKTYDKKKYVLSNLNLTIDDGEFVFIMGPSGAGKTTLTKLLLREEKVSSGKLFVDNYRLDKIPNRKVPYLRRNMGFVFQDFRLFDNKTVFENVAFAMEVLGESKNAIREKVPIALGIVGLLGKENYMPRKLSGGEKQRLCVARAIVNNPGVIVADEPTGNLDTALAKEIMDLLVRIAGFGKTVIVVTHASELVKTYDKRIITLNKGEVVGDTKYDESPAERSRERDEDERDVDGEIENNELIGVTSAFGAEENDEEAEAAAVVDAAPEAEGEASYKDEEDGSAERATASYISFDTDTHNDPSDNARDEEDD